MDGRLASHLGRLVAAGSSRTTRPAGSARSARSDRLRSRAAVLAFVASLVTSVGSTGVAPAPVFAADPVLATWYVGPGGGTDGDACDAPAFEVGDGYTATSAIQAAVNGAASGDTVFLCDDRYDLDATIGLGTSAATSLTIEGESTAGTVVDGRTARRLFDATGKSIAFERLTLQHGSSGSGGAVVAQRVAARDAAWLNNSAGQQSGGAIYAAVSIEVTGGSFVGNSSSNGGALYTPGLIALSGVTLAGNQACYGGAVEAEKSGIETPAVVVAESVFTDNTAASQLYSGCSGGGILSGGSLTVTNSTFTANRAGVDGGAIWSAGATSIVDSRFADNTAGVGTVSVARGGAVVVDAASDTGLGASLQVSRSVFTGNRVVARPVYPGAAYGGAIYGLGTVAVEDSTFVDGSTGGQTGQGGAIFGVGSVSVERSDLRGNVAAGAVASGGAIDAVTDLWLYKSVLEGNRATGTSYSYGGAVLAPAASVSGSTITGSTATQGGAMEVDGALTVEDSRFAGNAAVGSANDAYAGAVLVYGGPVRIGGSTFSDNTSAGFSGAMYVRGSVEIVRSEFTDNSAASYAGAVEIDGPLTIEDSVFERNVARGEFAGALWAFGPWSVTRTRFEANRSAVTGGAIFANTADGAVVDSTFVGNHAGATGGAIKLAPSGLLATAITGSSFVGNSAGGDGAAVYAWSQHTHITNSSFLENTAGTAGPGSGAIFAEGPVQVDLRNVTLLRNDGSAGTGGVVAIEKYGTVPTVSLANTILGSGMDACSLAGPLRDRGGNVAVTATTSGCVDPAQAASMTIASATALHFEGLVEDDGPSPVVAIGAGSVAKDYGRGTLDGTDATGFVCLDDGDPWSVRGVDQRGVGRPQYAACDSGAFEVEPTPGAYVVGADGGTGTCADHETIAEALEDAVDGDTVHVCGRHVLHEPLVLDGNLTFEGDSSTSTIVDGRGTLRLFDAWGPDKEGEALYDITLGTMTLRNGLAVEGWGAAGFGGAVLARKATIVDARFRGNDAERGGAVYATRVLATRAWFVGNAATKSGGAIADIYGDGITVVDSVFDGNAAGYDGGAIADDGAVQVLRSSFVENEAGGVGGAIRGNGVAVVDATFDGNEAPEAGAVGVWWGRVDVTGATFVGNRATSSGGGAIRSLERIAVANSTFVANSSASFGGAIDGFADIVATHSTFVDNTAASGGTTFSAAGELQLDHALIAGAGYACQVGSMTEAGGSLVAGTGCGTVPEVIRASLRLGELADAGGPTKTIALRTGSAAIDTTDGPCAVAFDQRGRARPYGGGGCDAGAYEAGAPTRISFVLTAGNRTLGADRTINPDESLWISATVTGTLPDPSGSGTLDPTSGSGRLYYCFGASVAPTSCTSGDWTPTWPGPIDLDHDISPTDGRALIDQVGWVPQGGWQPGWYLIAAVYDSSSGAYAGSESTGDAATSLVRVGSPVAATFAGPWVVNSSTTVRSLALSATLDPPTAGCTVTFTLGDPAVRTATGVSRADGTVSATLTDVAPGTYQVSVDLAAGGSCVSAGADTASLLVAPGSVAKGVVGGGSYRLGEGAAWARNDFALTVSVSTAYDKRTKLTTTTTRGELLWVSDAPNTLGKAGWRLRSSFAVATTDGTSAWSPRACTSPGACGRLAAKGTLEQWSGRSWVVASGYGNAGLVAFTVSVSDGGTTRTCVKKTCRTADNPDAFGVTIVGVTGPGADASAAVPQVGEPRLLRAGSISVF